MSGRAKLWYLGAAMWTIAFIIAVVTSQIVLAGFDIVMVIMCLVVGDES